MGAFWFISFIGRWIVNLVQNIFLRIDYKNKSDADDDKQ